MVDTTNVQDPLAFGKFSNEGGTAQQHKNQVFIGATQMAGFILSQARSLNIISCLAMVMQSKPVAGTSIRLALPASKMVCTSSWMFRTTTTVAAFAARRPYPWPVCCAASLPARTPSPYRHLRRLRGILTVWPWT